MTPLESVALEIARANCGNGENPQDWIKYYMPDAVGALTGLARADEAGFPVCMNAVMKVADRHKMEWMDLQAIFLDILAEIRK